MHQEHKLQVTYERGKLVASCACGQWERERLLLSGERPSKVMQAIEEEFEKHVAASLPD